MLVCPKECKCLAQSLICNNLDTSLHQHIWISVKYLKCFSCNLFYGSKLFSSFQSIMFLNIKNYLLHFICIKSDNNIPVLYFLKHFDISSNRLTQIQNNCFFPLNRLATFHLQKNLISKFEDNSFHSLSYLHLLDLSHNRINKLKSTIFNGLTSIKAINLTFNLIMYVDIDTFKLVSPHTIHSCNIKVCCMSGSWTKCEVRKGAFYNCDDLLSNQIMKCFYFVIGSMSIVLNITSLFLDVRKIKKSKKQTQIYSAACLPFFHAWVGVYLLTIAFADWHYKENYVGLEMSWRNSIPCRLASFLILVSMMASPVILCIVMVTRFCVIKWPMTSKFKDKSFVKKVMEISLTTVICFCIILISTILSLIGNLGFTGICIPLFTSNTCSLPLLVTTLFIVAVQFSCFVTIVILSILSIHILKNGEKCTATKIKNRKYRKVSHKLLMAILTNFCCWIPSSSVFLLPLFGYQVPYNLLNWITVIVVPINSVLNPIIFTILSPEMKQKLLNLLSKVSDLLT